jgi:thioredoxin 1
MAAKVRPIELDSHNFDRVIQESDQPVLVDFWAAWCGPCRVVGPIVDELATEYEGRIRFGKVNVDENPQLARTYQIQSIPTLMVFTGGQAVQRLVGALSRPELRNHLDSVLAARQPSDGA